ncbi:T9SS type A sorting domain-containing protein [Chryseobacterium luquanense]|uniref:T9SS type A sorting domain-containing protein n=1 Tax=Chryseobacterium luquanense TaxID=2983766 RepID=A0ABT3Y3P7_9FLAO|nr:T9SS type A sorting domain-containing protein [Chryseobacterium luquanense]MCX8532775.1 T9SS type A sorting domain-containing protein [Chryseobacterium luquanense]
MKRLYVFAFFIPMLFQSQTFSEVSSNIKNFYYGSSDIGDFNNDGKPDVVYNGAIDNDADGNADITFNEIYSNNNGVFSAYGNLGIDVTHLGDIKFIDYNNDGLLDIVSTGLSYNNVVNYKHYRFLNNGTGFAKVEDTAGKIYGSIEVFDLNHDGKQDYAINGTQYVDGTGFVYDLSLYQNTVTGFQLNQLWLPGTQNGSFKVLDLNNDNLLDVVVFGYDENTNPVFKTYLNSNNGLQLSQTLLPLASGKMAYADFNGDGFLDLVAIGQDDNYDEYLGVFINDGTGQFAETEIPNEGLSASSVDVGDLNNDGYYDFIVIGDDANNDGVVNVFLYNTTSSSFTKASNTSLYNLGGTGNVRLFDYDGNNHLDVLMTGFDWADQDLNSFTKLYQNTSTAANLKPTAPANLNLTKTGNTFNFTWSGATDDKTPVNALQYEIKVGTTPGAQDVAKYVVTTPSWFLILDPSIQDVYWSVRSIDASKVYSEPSVEHTLSVDGFSSKTQLSIYPNPASEKIFIKGETASIVEMYSMDGKKLNVQLNSDQSITVSDLPKGMYILKIKIKDNWVNKKLMIK